MRLWRTVRHLKPVQVYGRAWFRLARPKPDLSPAPALRVLAGCWVSPAARPPSMTGPRAFRFLNVDGAQDEIGWDGPEREKLWRYNQHYFDDLNAEGAANRVQWHRALIEEWIGANPPGQGTGWEPYPTSLRIVNWIKWALAGNPLSAEARWSLAVQARWLIRRLEWHLLGNHLFANAKALLFAGSVFAGPEAERWLARGEAILARQMPEQILPDGGHFELSTMYHALALEDMLDLVNLARTRGGTAPELAVSGMLRWLAAMCHPDGQIAFFNDAAFGVAPVPAALIAYAERLGFSAPAEPGPLTWHEDTGYARLAAGPAVLLADLARIGPEYLPGHAHADTLSFELSLYGQRVIVNGGTSVYGYGPERSRQRGTAAHSTATVAGADSSEVWGGFRVARRAYPFDLRVTEDPDGALSATGAHDGYRRLPGAPVHRRDWRLTARGLSVSDSVNPAASAEARYLLAPGIQVETTGVREGTLSLHDGESIRWRADGGPVRIEPARWHHAFGQSQDTQCLVLPLADGASRMTFDWS
ncbi:hypothetical protein Thimo_1018 [Thioflavicoccus mobilis 8321]|uniref:Uncharacterized protein n=1 Tax=Thioflavicoccus mobilis 8321 TaxID=765912 RepID=L0GWZ9_9GAMM|nr:heparinase II/III family protein [Thioflavicoccus mobilis]AGA89834.1 hypothetical protein Thimo_1018 [Thioflavicoccus mobilis 8321]